MARGLSSKQLRDFISKRLRRLERDLYEGANIISVKEGQGQAAYLETINLEHNKRYWFNVLRASNGEVAIQFKQLSIYGRVKP